MIKKTNAEPPVGTKTTLPEATDTDAVRQTIIQLLDEEKAENIQEIDLAGKSDMADCMIIASGRSNRHVAALADKIILKLKEIGIYVTAEGLNQADWVLIDAYDIIIHLFRPEIRELYNLEKMWSMIVPPPAHPA